MAKQTMVQHTKPDGSVETLYVDVELRGRTIPLLGLKKAVAGKGYRQADIAAATAKFNGGSPLHQTSISGYMNGKVEMHAAVVSVMESLLSDTELDQLAAKAATTAAPKPMVNHNIAQSLGVSGGSPGANGGTTAGRFPSFARTLDSIPTDGNAPLAPAFQAAAQAAQAAKPTMRPFPMNEAYKVAEMVRQAQKSGELTATFSLRKLLMWGRAFYLLQHEGYEYDEALAGAFHLAAEGKTYGEERTFLKNAYQAVFASECRPPKPNRKIRKGTGNRHPMAFLIKPIIEQDIPVWLHGPTGSGKTHAALELAEEIVGPGSIRIQGTGDMTVDDLLGGWAADNGSTKFEYGPLPLAMKNGKKLIIDEITACPAEVLFELQAVLEGNALVIKKNRGERVEAKPGFSIVACDNTLGLGENAEYVGTNVMNEAFRDRFLFVEFDYMPADQEKAAIQQVLDAFLTQRGWAA